jgi:hypothetical protein
MAKDRWTPTEEATLQELLSRKAQIIKSNQLPVDKVAEVLAHKDPGILSALMIQNAGEIRDVLEPFDDGTRPLAQG